MADETSTEKVKQTVPALVRTAQGVADHAAAVQAMQYDSERKAFRDPRTATLALFAYAKLTATLLREAEERLAEGFAEVRAQLDQRAAALDARLTAIEMWKVETEKQGAAMAADLESMISGDPQAVIENMRANLAALHSDNGKPALAPSSIVEGAVVQLKPEKAADKKREREEKREEKKGGVA